MASSSEIEQEVPSERSQGHPVIKLVWLRTEALEDGRCWGDGPLKAHAAGRQLKAHLSPWAPVGWTSGPERWTPTALGDGPLTNGQPWPPFSAERTSTSPVPSRRFTVEGSQKVPQGTRSCDDEGASAAFWGNPVGKLIPQNDEFPLTKKDR